MKWEEFITGTVSVCVCHSIHQSANSFVTWSMVCQKCHKLLICHLRQQRRESDARQDSLCVSCCPAHTTGQPEACFPFLLTHKLQTNFILLVQLKPLDEGLQVKDSGSFQISLCLLLLLTSCTRQYVNMYRTETVTFSFLFLQNLPCKLFYCIHLFWKAMCCEAMKLF